METENEIMQPDVQHQEAQNAEKQKKAKKKPRSSSDKVTISLLSGILVVGICLLCVSIVGMIGAFNNKPSVEAETTTASQQEQPTLNQSVNVQQPAVETTTASQGENTENDAPEGSAMPATNEQWLAFFNTSINKLKSEAPGMKKAKQTRTIDVQLSNPLGNTVVEAQKDKYLSNKIVETEIAKGDKASAQANISPDGQSFVSSLTMADIKSISGSADASGNYVINIAMNDLTNPDLSSSYAKIFEFMLVDDVMDTYAPDMGATVDRNNVELKYSNCSLTATISPDGKVVSYKTIVNANMILKDAKVKVIKTDLDATLLSETNYTNIVW